MSPSKGSGTREQLPADVASASAGELPFGARPGRRLRVPSWVLNVDYAITGVLFALLVLLTAWGVVRRYVLGDPISWLEEVQLILFVAIIFLGAGAAFRTHAHIGIEFIVERFHGPVRRVLETLISLIVLAVLVYFVFRGLDVVQMSAMQNRTSNILNIPYAVAYVVLPVGCAWMIVNYVLVTWFGAGEQSEVDAVLAEVTTDDGTAEDQEVNS